MLLQPTLDRLRELRLLGMAAALEEQALIQDVRSLSFEDRLALLVEREHTCREDRRLTRLLQLAKLHENAAIEDIEFRRPRALDKSLVLRLAGCNWIEAHEAGYTTAADSLCPGHGLLSC